MKSCNGESVELLGVPFFPPGEYENESETPGSFGNILAVMSLFVMLGDNDDLVELKIGFHCQSSERLFKRSSSLFSVIPGRFSIRYWNTDLILFCLQSSNL